MRVPGRHPAWLCSIGGLLLAALILAFGSCAEEETTTTPTATSGGGAAGGGGGTGGSGGQLFGGGDPCPSGLLCGQPAGCCDLGFECVDGSCVSECPSGVRCESNCCQAAEVCVAGSCAAPSGPCADSFDCDEDEFCEPTLSQCLPQPPGGPSCEHHPAALPFNPLIEWSWTGSNILPQHHQIASPPVVADLDQDGIPEVIVLTYGYDPGYAGTVLRALDGATGAEKWDASADVYDPQYQVGQFGAAAGDLDGDGAPELVVGRRGGGLIAFRGDGSLLWTSTLPNGTPWSGVCGFNHGEVVFEPSVVIANMDTVGGPEIVGGGVIFDAAGHVIAGLGRECAGDNGGYSAPVSIIADINNDGTQDVVSGRDAYGLNDAAIWTYGGTDGYTAIADLDNDGGAELITIASGFVRVHNAATGAVLATLDMPGQGRGGAPTVADFDADGTMEFSSANGDHYSVFEYSSTPAPAITVKWSQPTQDLSSNCTGSSVFDFEADGSAEVLYNDECFFRVYSGLDGTVLYQDPSSTGTAVEYPVVVDVDGDHNTEIVVVSNDNGHLGGSISCPYGAGQTPRHGVFVYGDANDKWVRTRRVWNQHAYHITNVNADGTVPMQEVQSWGPAGFNNYRVSAQGSGVYNAPDLRLDLSVYTAGCPLSVVVRATVRNEGSLGVGPGVLVSFFYGTDATGEPLGELSTQGSILPGGSEHVELTVSLAGRDEPHDFYATVDGQSAAGSLIDECLEDNNDAAIAGVTCPTVR